MNSLASLRCITIVACLTASASVLLGQTSSIQLFGPVNVRLSTGGTTFQNPKTFSSTTLNLSCPASGVSAVVSSGPNGTGNVLVDNFISLVTTVGTTTSSPTNICSGGVVEGGGTQNDCFTSSYQSQAGGGGLTGQDPDQFVSTGGVAPLNIVLPSGPVQAQFNLVDTGGYLTSSTLYLTTNCTQTGVVGPGNITGNPISQTNPTPQELTQTFPFDSTEGQEVRFTYDLSLAQSDDTLTIANNNTIPNTADQAIDPSTFQSVFLANTSFATANCLVHTGELLPSGLPACKLYTLECQVGTGSTQSGRQCPVSQIRNEIFQDTFDGPSFTLPDITAPGGTVFHQGIGFLEASEPWTGGACAFDPLSNLANTVCPQNVETNFSGPGRFVSTGTGNSSNSSFITIAPIPEDLTAVTIQNQTPFGWINSDTATVNFSSTPPVVPPPTTFIASPIQSITYGISGTTNVPSPGPPIPGDIVLANSIPCQTSNAPPATVFSPPSQTITVTQDGQYLIHYFAQDCAGTEELKFTQDATASWSTSFYTVPLNVDTMPPQVTSGPTLSPAPSTNYGVANSYFLNQPVTATYSCSDSLSGVVRCGTATFGTPTPSTNPITSPVDTSTPGPHTYTVTAVDAAGNQTSASVKYVVVAPPVSLAIGKLAPPYAKTGSRFTYAIGVLNISRNSASGVTVTDPLPAGVSLVSASAVTGRTQCSVANNTVTCTRASLGPLDLIGVEIVVRVTATQGTISNTATVTSENPSSLPNQSTAITKIRQSDGEGQDDDE